MAFYTLLTILSVLILNLNGQQQNCTEEATRLETINAPTFNAPLSGLSSDILTLGFDWGRTTTRTVVPSSYSGACFFVPQYNASFPEPDCYAAFTVSSSFSSLTTNPACGTTSIQQGSPAATIWRIPLTLAGNETFLDQRSNTQQRTLVYPLLIQIGFPEFVTAEVALQAYAPVLIDAFITSQIYSADTKLATIIFRTVIGYPFQLIQQLFQPNPIVISGTEINGFSASLSAANPSVLSTVTGTQSEQTWILTITPPANACTFTGRYNISNYLITCIASAGANCPAINNNQAAAVSLSIESENFCAQTSAVVGVVPLLKVYKDSLFSNEGANFLVDDLPVQSGFFEMSVSSAAVTITDLTITTIRVSSSSAVLLASGTPTTTVTIYNNGTWINNIGGLFGFGSAGPIERFKIDMVSNLFDIPVDTAVQITVQVTSRVTYLGGKKRDVKRVLFEELISEHVYVVEPEDGQQKEVQSLAFGLSKKAEQIGVPKVPEVSVHIYILYAIAGTVLTIFGVVLVVLSIQLYRRKKYDSYERQEKTTTINPDSKDDGIFML